MGKSSPQGDHLAAEKELSEQFSRRLSLDDVDLDGGFDSMSLARRRMLELIGDVDQRSVLDVGCGLGRLSVSLARRGARVTALDISEGMLRFTQGLAGKYGVGDRLACVQAAAEEMPFEDQTFDAVVGSAILHHLALPAALPELRRVMRPGAPAVFQEPLGHNPLLNLFRKVTPSLRSPGETPFTMAAVERLRDFFPGVTHEEHYLLTLPLFALKKLLKNPNWGRSLLPPAVRVDDALIRAVPSLGKYCWITILRGVRP